jgi:hypothetical protein
VELPTNRNGHFAGIRRETGSTRILPIAGIGTFLTNTRIDLISIRASCQQSTPTVTDCPVD